MNLNTAEYLNELDAAVLTGVSSKTLKRFAEAGYFSVDTNADGSVKYQRQALCDVFGITVPPAPTEPVQESKIIDLNLERAKSQQKTDTKSDVPVEAASADVVSPEGVPSETAPTAADTAVNTEAHSANHSNDAQRSTGTTLEPSDDALSGTVTAASEQAASEQAAQDTARARKTGTIDLLERLIERLEDEIRGLKSERQWLRERVERLEEKAERDQLLLLAESQTIKRLVSSANRKSSVRQALEWFGLLPPTDDDGNAVERKALPPSSNPAQNDGDTSEKKSN